MAPQTVTDEQALMVVCSVPECLAPVGRGCLNPGHEDGSITHTARRKAARLLIYGDAQAKPVCRCLSSAGFPKSKYATKDAAAQWIRKWSYEETKGKEFSMYHCPVERDKYHITTKKGTRSR